MVKRVMHNPSYTTRHAQSRTGPASPDWRLGGWTFPASISVHTATGTWRLDVYCCGGAATTVLLLPYYCNVRLSAIGWFTRDNCLLGLLHPNVAECFEFSYAHANYLNLGQGDCGLNSVSCIGVEVSVTASYASKKPATECNNSLQRPVVKFLIHNELMRNGA